MSVDCVVSSSVVVGCQEGRGHDVSSLSSSLFCDGRCETQTKYVEVLFLCGYGLNYLNMVCVFVVPVFLFYHEEDGPGLHMQIVGDSSIYERDRSGEGFHACLCFSCFQHILAGSSRNTIVILVGSRLSPIVGAGCSWEKCSSRRRVILSVS